MLNFNVFIFTIIYGAKLGFSFTKKHGNDHDQKSGYQRAQQNAVDGVEHICKAHDFQGEQGTAMQKDHHQGISEKTTQTDL